MTLYPNWNAFHSYNSGDLVVPTITNGFFYTAQNTAISGPYEPGSNNTMPWPTTIGVEISDGGVTWQCTGETSSFNVTKWFPDNIRGDGLYDQVLWALQKIYDDTHTNQQDSAGKYTNFAEHPVDILSTFIAEEGYQSIVDVLALAPQDLVNLAGTLGLIRAMKGHKSGLLLVLTLLGFDGSSTVEWWENGPTTTPYTFDLTLNLNGISISGDTLDRLFTFIHSYVWPTLRILTLLSQLVTEGTYSLAARDQEFTGSFSTSV